MSTEMVRASTLDSALAELGAQRVGFEEDVLKGAVKTLGQLHSPIVMEVAPYHAIERELNPDESARLLAGFGYRFYDLGGRLLPRQRACSRTWRQATALTSLPGRIEDGAGCRTALALGFSRAGG